jgi:hypothetical protein
MPNKTNEEREVICNVWKQSGLTQTEFCKQNNICSKSLSRWLSKFRSSDTNKNNTNSATVIKTDNIKATSFKFLQVGNITPEKNFIEIILPNGINFKLTLPQNNLNNFLQELLQWK